MRPLVFADFEGWGCEGALMECVLRVIIEVEPHASMVKSLHTNMCYFYDTSLTVSHNTCDSDCTLEKILAV